MIKNLIWIGVALAVFVGLPYAAFADTYACTASDSSEIKDGKLRYFNKKLGEGQIWLLDDELKSTEWM